MDQLLISATAHGVNYLPEYYADATGGFARRGLTVSARARDPWAGVLDDLACGEADVALGGIWVIYAENGPDLVAVVQHEMIALLRALAVDPARVGADVLRMSSAASHAELVDSRGVNEADGPMRTAI